MQEKEYFCPEPTEEDEDHPGDGPVFYGESIVYTGGLSRISYQQSREPTEENKAL